LTKQYALNGGDCWDSNALIAATAIGAGTAGFMANVPVGAGQGLRGVGRMPNIWVDRPLKNYGPNAVRLLKQEAFGGSVGNALQYGATQVVGSCGCENQQH
jgi:hypothetical protein